MASSLSQTDRVDTRVRAMFVRLQAVLGTSFEFEVKFGNPLEMGQNRIQTGRTSRGAEDPLAFAIELHPETLSVKNEHALASDLFHEWLHAILFDFADAGAYRLRGGERAALVRSEEVAVYELERRLWPFVQARMFRRKGWLAYWWARVVG